MKTQHVFSASAAAVLVASMAAFAQSSQPSPQTGTPRDSSPQTSTQAESQSARQPETPVTLVGCVMRETDYRKAMDTGKGGPVGTGLGRGDEFVLVNANKTTAGSTAAAPSDCSTAAPGGQAFELSGSGEKDVAQYVGRAVEISGTLKEAETRTGPAGEPKPTGGFDPLSQDLKLFEVDVVSVRPTAAQTAAATPSPAAQSQEPASAAQSQPAAPPAPATPSAQQSASAASRTDLPRTASQLPLTGLLGLLALASGLALRRLA